MLVLATANPGKLAELARLLAPMGVAFVAAAERGVTLPPETGATYVANATLKAAAAARATAALALGDDTGMAVACLGGAPGVDTAGFVAQAGGQDAARRELAERTGVARGESVAAALRCALVLCDRDRVLAAADVAIAGHLRWPPGDAPGLAAMFVPEGGAAVITDGVLVHRRRAFEQLWPALRQALADAG